MMNSIAHETIPSMAHEPADQAVGNSDSNGHYSLHSRCDNSTRIGAETSPYFPLLDLPIELRDIIYSYICEDEPPFLLPGHKKLAHSSGLMGTNRLLHREFSNYITAIAPLIVVQVDDLDFDHAMAFLDNFSDHQLSRFAKLKSPPRKGKATGARTAFDSKEAAKDEMFFIGGARMFAVEIEKRVDWSSIICQPNAPDVLHLHPWQDPGVHTLSSGQRRMQMHLCFPGTSDAVNWGSVESWLDRALKAESHGSQIDFEYCFPKMERRCFNLVFDDFFTWVRAKGRRGDAEVQKIGNARRFLGPSALEELRAVWRHFGIYYFNNPKV